MAQLCHTAPLGTWAEWQWETAEPRQFSDWEILPVLCFSSFPEGK